MNKKQWGCVVLAAVFIITICYIWSGQKKVFYQKQGKSAISNEETKKAEKNKENYLVETIYDGFAEIPAELYEHSFGITEEYIENREYINTISQEQYEVFQKTAEDYVKKHFQISYREIMRDTEDYVRKYQELFSESMIPNKNGVLRSTQDIGESYANRMIENHVSMDGTLLTDKSLLYKDIYPTLRGLVGFTVQSCDDLTILEKFTDISPLEKGKTYYMICDFTFSSEDENHIQISNIRKIA